MMRAMRPNRPATQAFDIWGLQPVSPGFVETSHPALWDISTLQRKGLFNFALTSGFVIAQKDRL